MNNPYTPDFEEQVRETVAMPQANPAFVSSLWNRLAVQQPTRKPSAADRLAVVLHSRWMIPATVIITLAILFTVLGHQRVLAAVQTLFRYLPGVGQVADISQTALLSNPVHEERDGYTVTVENLVASPERTWLRLKVEGWQEDPEMGKRPEIPELPSLMAKNSISLLPNQSDIYLGDALYAEYQFPALPTGTKQVTLTIPQFPETQTGKVPEDWVFILHLRSTESKDTLPDAWSNPRSSTMVNGVTMTLLQIVQDAEQTSFTLRFETPTLNSTLTADWFSQLSLKDAQGRIYPVMFEQNLSGRTFIFRTRPIDVQENLTLRLDQLHLVDEPPDDGSAPSFALNLGAAPLVGQHWTLNQSIKSGSVDLHILGVTLQTITDGSPVLVFDVEGEDIQGVMFGCSTPVCVSSTTADMGSGQGQFLHPVIQLEKIPAGELQITLKALFYAVEGPWEIQWQPNSVPVGLRHPTTPVVVTTPQYQPTSSRATSTPDVQSSNAQLANEVDRLLHKGFQELYGQAGWVHVVYENIEPENTDSFRNGRLTGSAHSIGETWQYVEADGTISKQVWLEKTPDGAVLQKSARVGKTQVNFTAGTAVDDPSLETKALIDPLLDAILQASQRGVEVSQEKVVLGDRPCLLITLRTTFNPPTVISSIPGKVAQTEYRSWIDQETGLVVKVETVYGLENNSDFVLQSMLYTTKERINEPPIEIRELLNAVP